MNTPLPADDPLVAFLSGKRQSPRFESGHAVVLRGATAEYEGRTLDASAGGVRVYVSDPAFYRDGETGLTLVTAAFPNGLDVFFPETGTSHHAEVVRITSEEDGGISLGCRFFAVLSPEEAALLDVGEDPSADVEGAGAALPKRPRPGVALSFLVFGSGEPVAGPLYVARVDAAGDALLDIRLPGADGLETRVADELGRDAFYGTLVRGRRRLWEGRARLVRVSVAQDEILLRVLLEGKLGRAFARSLEAA